MKKYVCILASLALLAACEQKETTVTNPPAEKKENKTTVVNPPAEKKESNTTIINPSQNQSPATTTKEKTDINIDRKSTRLNSSHVAISYAVFCLKKKTQTQ